MKKKPRIAARLIKAGGEQGSRTPDLLHAMQAL
jgi:hypothetical protein